MRLSRFPGREQVAATRVTTPHGFAAVSFEGSDLAHRKPGYVEITCDDPNLCRSLPSCEYAKTMATLAGGSARVAEGRMSKVAFAELEVATGFRHNPHGVTQSEALQLVANPIEVATYDWVHSVLQGGILVAEVEALLVATSLPRETLQAFLADTQWRFPHCNAVKSRQLHRVFDPRRGIDNEPHKVRGSCAEFLGLYGMLRCFVALRLGGDPTCERHVASFNAVSNVIDCILDVKRCLVDVRAGADRLEAAVRRHLALHTSVYGAAHIRPKHHWMLDLPQQLRRDGAVLDAFVIERTHLRVKAVAETIKNTRAFERSALASLLTTVLQDREMPSDGLLGRSAPLPGAALAVRVADKLRVWGTEIAVQDVVVLNGSAACVVACAQEAGVLTLLVHPLHRIQAVSEYCDVCELRSELAAWSATDVTHALAWRSRRDGSLMVVRR